MFEIKIPAHCHDAYLKLVFSVPARAAAFFRSHLSEEVTRTLDWESLEVVPGSFVKGEVLGSHSDLVFCVKAGAGGPPLLLYLLFEHQTTVDPMMPLRLLGYIKELLDSHLRQHGLPMPPVLPFVLHQGPDRWTVPTQFASGFDLAPGLLEGLGP